jgi:hypothetical protein
MQASASPSPDELLALVPPEHIHRRTRRYVGDSVAVSLARIAPDDVAIVRMLYGFLEQIYRYVGPRLDGGAGALAGLQGFIAGQGFEQIQAGIGSLGATLSAAETPIDVRKAYHDVRGGGLPGLMLHLDAVASGEGQTQDLERIFLLCRDQLKIIRNAIPDLDPAGYAQDLEDRAHTTELLRAKWSTDAYRLRDVQVELHLRCDFDGAVSERCMEFAALDRVIYNLVNNAARFAADRRVDLEMFPISDAAETDLRFVVMNRVGPEHRERLRGDLGDDLSRVFEGGYTTGGYGLGLRICGDFVTHGYNLPSLRAALGDGYLGARLIRDTFVAWFHWPARRGVG